VSFVGCSWHCCVSYINCIVLVCWYVDKINQRYICNLFLILVDSYQHFHMNNIDSF
jgi:hypothetical protein